MYFILSTGRSGTTTISKLLSSSCNSICLHEPEPALILESSQYRYNEIRGRKIRNILLKTRKNINKEKIYGESNQCLSLIIPVLKDTFPNAKYIWLIRNGMDVVASTMQKQWYTGHSENNNKYENCTPIEKLWIDGRIRADKCGRMEKEKWNSISRFEKCCWYWSYVNEIIESDLKFLIKSEYFNIIKLEELEQGLMELMKWLELKSESLPLIEIHNSAKREPYHWSIWNNTEKEIFNYWCGHYMDRFYPNWRIETEISIKYPLYVPALGVSRMNKVHRKSFFSKIFNL
jgi:Sulfotransferase domain